MTGSVVSAFSVRHALVLVFALAMWGGMGLSDPLHAKPASGSGKKTTRTAKTTKSASGSGGATKAARPTNGPSKAEISAKRSELKDIGRRLGDLQRDLEKTENQQTEAARAMADVEREVSKATRALRHAMSEHAEADRQLAELKTEQQQLEEHIAVRQKELSEWLHRNYLYGTPSGIVALLAAYDPNQSVRDSYYLERLGHAQLELIEGLKANLRLKAEHAQQADTRRITLVRLEDDRRRRREKQEETYARRRETLGKIQATLKTQKERMATLKADEGRLTQIVNTLVQRAAEAEARAAAARRERERASARARVRQNSVASRRVRQSPNVGKNDMAEPVVGKVQEIPEPMPGGMGFAQLRGKLNFPVAGELLGRFGTPRAGQGTAWRGVFIRAPNGAKVRAVSDGTVAYSDWLRGYGNLLIIDHGGGYLSIYGNNDALYKKAGDSVRTGEAIASVGASGSEAESGLYFEIRHQGQAIDPLQWVRLK